MRHKATSGSLKRGPVAQDFCGAKGNNKPAMSVPFFGDAVPVTQDAKKAAEAETGVADA